METINLNLDNLTENERKQLMNLVEKGNKPKSKVWKPEIGETYWSIHFITNSPYSTTWTNDDCDNTRYSLGFVKKTGEEIEYLIEYLKIKKELQDFADENNDGEIDLMDENIKKHYIGILLTFGNIVGTHSFFSILGNNTYFTSEELAEQAIEHIGSDRLKKYYFNIK